MRVTVLASGSKGNAMLVEADAHTRLLVDAGLDPDTLLKQLAAAGYDARPTAIVLTHAHGDHSRFANLIAGRWRLPVYVTEATKKMVRLDAAPTVRVFGKSDGFRLGELEVGALPIPHDAPQVSLRFSHAGRSAVIATDLGEVEPALVRHCAGADVVLIESNHDVDMLWHGPYTHFLKRRVASGHGHLSNVQTAAFLRRLPREVRTVVLMHLSEVNNRPEIALHVAAEALGDHAAQLVAARQWGVTRTETVTPRQLSLF
ncbi:MAG: MBL fold metallo-hydrolase [Myxococcales bacterium]|nr:MBL fold metallo-hydrolase [Myxococcales bacterium]